MRFAFDVRTIHGVMTVDAWRTATPGLVVHRTIGLDGGLLDDWWSVSHERSGYAVGRRQDPERAMQLAAQLAPVADWTLSGAELREQIGASHGDLERLAGVDLGGHTGHNSTPEGLNA